MANIKEHENDCLEILGDKFTNVHGWLDQYSEKYPVNVFGDQHRQYLHNEKGLNEIKKKLGNKAFKAGGIHIIKDLVGYIPTVFNIGGYHFKDKGRKIISRPPS